MSDERNAGKPLIPVGVERVIVAAAVNASFKAELLADREAAVRGRGLILSPSELSMLRAIPEQQLLQAIGNMDTSAANLERRAFLGAVAASAATVIAGEALSGCSLGIRPEEQEPVQTAGVRPEPPVSRQPDMATPPKVEAPKVPSVPGGVRPQGPQDPEEKRQQLNRTVPPPASTASEGGISPHLPVGAAKPSRPTAPQETDRERLNRAVPPPAHSGTKGGINPDLPAGVGKRK